MMEELNRLAEEREEIEDLARHNQAEVENQAQIEFEEMKLKIEQDHQDEMDRLAKKYADMLEESKRTNERELNEMRTNNVHKMD